MFWQKTSGGYQISVRLTPKASRDAILGTELLSDGREVLKVHVRAVPEDGKANAALVKLLSSAFDLPKSAVELEKGATSRLKIVALQDSSEKLLPKFESFIQTNK